MISRFRQSLLPIKRRVRSLPLVCKVLHHLDGANLRRGLSHHANAKDLAILVLMPGSLHLGLLAEKYLERHKKVVLILNGLSSAEAALVGRRAGSSVIQLKTTTNHPKIIDALIQSLNEPFWIVDHDCYVLSNAFFTAEEWPMSSAGHAVFSFHNAQFDAAIPETFFMRLNPRELKRIGKRFSVTAGVYSHGELPEEARRALEAIGWSERSYPEPHKDYYDTLRVLALLSEPAGFGFEISPGYSTRCEIHPEVVHIGNTSHPQWSIDPSFYNAIGAYFWKMSLLEREDIARLEPYQIRSGAIPSLSHMRKQLIDAGCSPGLLNRLELIANGI